jgi:hypothetical protein
VPLPFQSPAKPRSLGRPKRTRTSERPLPPELRSQKVPARWTPGVKSPSPSQAPAEKPPVLVPAGSTARLTNTRLATGRAERPPADAVTVRVAHPWGASWPLARRPFQRTLAEEPCPVNERTVDPVDPVTVSRQRTTELERAWTPAEPPRSGLISEAVAEPP